jgi:hypothetical protein
MGMSVGVRARQMIIVNGDHEFVARSSLLSAANHLTVEQRELNWSLLTSAATADSKTVK